MAQTSIVESAKVMARGQITLPKAIRDFLNVEPGDRVLLATSEDGKEVIIKNAASYGSQQVPDSEIKG